MFGFKKEEQIRTPHVTELNDVTVGKPRRLYRNVVRSFKAAVSSRLNSKWPSMPISADVVVERNQRILVARSREQCSNNDYAKNYVRMVHQNVVGPTGVQLQAQIKTTAGKLDTSANDALELAWSEWSKKENCDIRAKQTWRSIQRSCVVSAAKDGEFFAQIIRGSQAGPWGFSLQLIDAQRCPIDYNAKLKNGSFIRQGIEFNAYGKPIAYYFNATDGDDVHYRTATNNYTRVVASDVIHGFLEDMIGQKRGLPWTSTSLFRLHQISEFEDSAIVNARVSANKMGFIQWKEGFGPKFSEEEGDEIQIESQAGEFPMLPEGAELKEWSPNYPTGEFLPFHKAMLRSMAAGMGVLYNNLASDLENVNFSSIRQGTLDEREHWKELQQWLIETLIEPVFFEWLKYSLLKGHIKKKNGSPYPAMEVDRFSKISWQARRWSWIDPSSEVSAAEKAKNNMLTSPGAVIREQGKDPQTVWAEAARDLKTMKDEYINQGFTAETAEEMVLASMGRKQAGAVGRPKESM